MKPQPTKISWQESRRIVKESRKFKYKLVRFYKGSYWDLRGLTSLEIKEYFK